MLENTKPQRGAGFDPESTLSSKIPPLPRTVADVAQLLSSSSGIPDTPGLIEIIRTDAVIASTVLRRVNTAFYGLQRRVSQIEKAVVLLGFHEVCNLVLASGLMQMKEVVKTKEAAEIYDRIMSLNVGAAVVAQMIGTRYQTEYRAEAFTAGLLHGIGRVVFLYNQPQSYIGLWDTTDSFMPLAEEEKLVFETDYSVLGGMAAEKWKLPSMLVNAIRSHTHPHTLKKAESQRFASCIALSADLAALLIQHSASKPNPEDDFIIENIPKSLKMFSKLHPEIDDDDILTMITSQKDRLVAFIGTMLSSP